MDDPPPLAAGRRPNFFAGRLLSAADLADEQRYAIERRRLLNRALHGAGVVCGLSVEPAGTAGAPAVVVGPGLALDGLGREVVVPEACTVPLPAAAGCASVAVAYREVLEDPTPGGQPATVVEGYEVVVAEGEAPAVEHPSAPEVAAALADGDLQRALCLLAAEPLPGAGGPVVLANVTLGAGGEITVDACRPRRVAAGGRLLAAAVAGG